MSGARRPQDFPDVEEELEQAIEDCSMSVIKLWQLLAAQNAKYDRSHDPHDPSEIKSRVQLIDDINVLLDGQPLDNFDSTHLEVLMWLYSFWRGLEEHAGAPAPQPTIVPPPMS
jgi:hypothetical protein